MQVGTETALIFPGFCFSAPLSTCGLEHTGHTNLQSLPLTCFQPLRYKIPTTGVRQGKQGVLPVPCTIPRCSGITLAPHVGPRARIRGGWYGWSLGKPRNEHCRGDSPRCSSSTWNAARAEGELWSFSSLIRKKRCGVFFPGKSQANSPNSGQVVKVQLCLCKQRLSHFAASHGLRWKCSKGR